MEKLWQPKLSAGTKPLYLAIVKALADDIAANRLSIGTRLPTHRELADSLGLAIGTVTRAYDEAEKRGLIHGAGRRGTFVGSASGEVSPGTNPFIPESPLIDLSIYYPSAAENPDLPTALRQLSRRRQTQWLLQYTPAEGLEHHRAAGAKWIGKLGMAVDPRSVIVTSGAQHALTVILSAVASPGELVLAEALTYPGLKGVAELLGLRVMGVPIDDEGIIPRELDRICEQNKVRALYCIPTMHNPTNAIMSEARRKEIALVAKKHSVFIIEDEINRALHPKPPSFVSSFALDTSFLIASVSKAVAAGLRVCFVRAPSEWIVRLGDVVRTTTLMTSPISLELFAHWLEDGTVDDTIRRRRAEAGVRQRIVSELFRHGSFGGQQFSFFVWLPLGDGWNAADYALEARARGVSVAPSQLFAIDESEAVNAVRICLGGTVSRETLRKALTTLAKIIEVPPTSGFTSM